VPISAILPSSNAAALCAAIAAPLLWSIGGVVLRGVSTAGPWDQVFWRALGGGLALAAALAWQDSRGAWRAWRHSGAAGWASAACIGATFIVHVLAINSTTVANVLFVQTACPLLVPVLAWLVLGERLDRRLIIAVAIAAFGLVPILAASIGGGRLVGDLLALSCAAFGAINFLIVRHARAKDMTPAVVAAAVITLAVSIVVAEPIRVAAWDVVVLVLLGVVQIAIGLRLFLFALRRLPAAPVALLTLIEPVVGPLLAWLIIGEVPPIATLVGGAIVLAALVLSVRAVGTRRDAPAETAA